MGDDREGVDFLKNPTAIVPDKDNADLICEAVNQHEPMKALLTEFVQAQPDDYGTIAALNTRVATFLGRPTVPDDKAVNG